MSVPQGETLRFKSNQKHSNPLRNPSIMSLQRWAAFVLGWRRWEAVRTRLKHFKNNAWEFSGISLRQKWDTESWKKNLCWTTNSYWEPKFVCSLTVLCGWNNNACPNRTWTTKLSEMRDSSTCVDTQDITGRPVQVQLAHFFRPHRDPNQERDSDFLGNRGISEAESYSCLCSMTLNITNQVMIKKILENAREVTEYAKHFQLSHWCFCGLGQERVWYHLAKNDYRFDALQIYCFGFNIKL